MGTQVILLEPLKVWILLKQMQRADLVLPSIQDRHQLVRIQASSRPVNCPPVVRDDAPYVDLKRGEQEIVVRI